MAEGERKMDLSHVRCLILDDDKFSRTMIKTALAHFGVRLVMEADSAIKAIEVLKFQPVDIVLVDQEMPGITGLEFVSLVRKGEEGITNTEVAVVMITGNTERETVMGAVKLGVREYLAKPISPAALEKRFIKALLSVKQKKSVAVL